MTSTPSGALNAEALARLAARHGDAVQAHAQQDQTALSDAYIALRAVAAAAAEGRRDLSPADVADGLAQVAAASAAIEYFEYHLMRLGRTQTEDGTPLLTWREQAAALGLDTEQAAAGRYNRRAKRHEPASSN